MSHNERGKQIDGTIGTIFCARIVKRIIKNPVIEKQNISPNSMKVLPVNFGTEHKQMLSHLAVCVSKGYLCILPKYDKLVISFRTAWANELSLDKEQTSYSDSLDALRLYCKMFRMK